MPPDSTAGHPTADNPLPKFKLGRLACTPGALAALRRADEHASTYLLMHAAGMWEELAAEDRRANEAAVAHEDDPERRGRVLSAYTTRLGERLWLITEADRSHTTVLLPTEY